MNRTTPPPLDRWEEGVRATDVPIAAAENGHFKFAFPEDEAANDQDKPNSDIGRHKIKVTFFRSKAAQSMRAEDLTLGDIAVRIAAQQRPTKPTCRCWN